MAAEVLPKGVSVVYRNRRGREVKLYQVRVTWQGRRELVGRFETLRDAKAAQIIAQADVLRGVFVPPSAIRAARREQDDLERQAKLNRYNVGNLAEDYLEHVRRMGRKESTIYDYRRRIEAHILPAFEVYPVDALTAQEVQDWFDKLTTENGNGAARGAYMVLAGMFNYATGQAKGQSPDFEPLVARTPCRVTGGAKHRPVRRAEAEDKVITREQISAIAAEMPGREKLAVLLSGWMALRIGEVLGLRRRDVADGWLNVSRALQSRGQGLRIDTPKTKAGTRGLPIPPDDELLHTLRDHLERYVDESPDAPLIPRADRGAEHLHPNVLRTHFGKAITAANVKLAAAQQPTIPPSFVWHALRHTSLTLLGEHGATTEELLLFAGQEDVATAQRYQHATKTRLQALVSKAAAGPC